MSQIPKISGLGFAIPAGKLLQRKPVLQPLVANDRQPAKQYITGVSEDGKTQLAEKPAEAAPRQRLVIPLPSSTAQGVPAPAAAATNINSEDAQLEALAAQQLLQEYAGGGAAVARPRAGPTLVISAPSVSVTASADVDAKTSSNTHELLAYSRKNQVDQALLNKLFNPNQKRVTGGGKSAGQAPLLLRAKQVSEARSASTAAGGDDDDAGPASVVPSGAALETYERVPIEEFGAAMLRGMGVGEEALAAAGAGGGGGGSGSTRPAGLMLGSAGGMASAFGFGAPDDDEDGAQPADDDNDGNASGPGATKRGPPDAAEAEKKLQRQARLGLGATANPLAALNAREKRFIRPGETRAAKPSIADLSAPQSSPPAGVAGSQPGGVKGALAASIRARKFPGLFEGAAVILGPATGVHAGHLALVVQTESVPGLEKCRVRLCDLSMTSGTGGVASSSHLASFSTGTAGDQKEAKPDGVKADTKPAGAAVGVPIGDTTVGVVPSVVTITPSAAASAPAAATAGPTWAGFTAANTSVVIVGKSDCRALSRTPAAAGASESFADSESQLSLEQAEELAFLRAVEATSQAAAREAEKRERERIEREAREAEARRKEEARAEAARAETEPRGHGSSSGRERRFDDADSSNGAHDEDRARTGHTSSYRSNDRDARRSDEMGSREARDVDHGTGSSTRDESRKRERSRSRGRHRESGPSHRDSHRSSRDERRRSRSRSRDRREPSRSEETSKDGKRARRDDRDYDRDRRSDARDSHRGDRNEGPSNRREHGRSSREDREPDRREDRRSHSDREPDPREDRRSHSDRVDRPGEGGDRERHRHRGHRRSRSRDRDIDRSGPQGSGSQGYGDRR